MAGNISSGYADEEDGAMSAINVTPLVDVTLASLWAGKPQITDLVIIRPVANLPLRRERVSEANPTS